MELKVRYRDPEDLESAFRAAIRVESYLRAHDVEHERETMHDIRNRRERFDDTRVYGVTRPVDEYVGEGDAMGSAFAELRAQLERSQKEGDELRTELDSLRLLAEQVSQPTFEYLVAQTVAPLSGVETELSNVGMASCDGDVPLDWDSNTHAAMTKNGNANCNAGSPDGDVVRCAVDGRYGRIAERRLCKNS